MKCSGIEVLNLHLQLHEIYFANVLALFLIFIYFASFGTDIIHVMTLQLPLHLLKLIMKE